MPLERLTFQKILVPPTVVGDGHGEPYPVTKMVLRQDPVDVPREVTRQVTLDSSVQIALPKDKIADISVPHTVPKVLETHIPYSGRQMAQCCIEMTDGTCTGPTQVSQQVQVTYSAETVQQWRLQAVY